MGAAAAGGSNSKGRMTTSLVCSFCGSSSHSGNSTPHFERCVFFQPGVDQACKFLIHMRFAKNKGYHSRGPFIHGVFWGLYWGPLVFQLPDSSAVNQVALDRGPHAMQVA